MAFIRRTISTVLMAGLAACVPHFTTYVHLRAPEGTFVPVSCGNAGPPVFARYERSGAQFEVTLERGFMRVRAPAITTVAIPDAAARVDLENGDPPIRLRLKPAATTNTGGMVEQRFDFEGLPPKIDFGGTLHLPDVIVNGKTVVAPVFEFYPQRYTGAAPGNC
jgi:hypothetical protein